MKKMSSKALSDLHAGVLVFVDKEYESIEKEIKYRNMNGGGEHTELLSCH